MAWGKGDCGQLGLGNFNGSPVPRVIQSLCAERVKQVACGSAHSLAVTEDGVVYAWGYGSDGQLGLGKQVQQADVDRPTKVHGLSSIKALGVTCGSRHSLCIAQGGVLFAWGLGDDGRLGLELSEKQTRVLEPAPVPLDGQVVQSCAAGGHHSLICTVNGHVLSCGRGTVRHILIDSAFHTSDGAIQPSPTCYLTLSSTPSDQTQYTPRSTFSWVMVMMRISSSSSWS